MHADSSRIACEWEYMLLMPEASMVCFNDLKSMIKIKQIYYAAWIIICPSRCVSQCHHNFKKYLSPHIRTQQHSDHRL